MKGNILLGIGLLLLSVTLILQQLINLPNWICLILLLIAIIIELIAGLKIRRHK